MLGLDAWDGVVLVIAGYVAVMGLLRLMQWRSQQIVTRLRAEAEREEQRQQAEALRAKGKQAREKKAA